MFNPMAGGPMGFGSMRPRPRQMPGQPMMPAQALPMARGDQRQQQEPMPEWLRGGTDVENLSRGGKAFSEMTNDELRGYGDRVSKGNIVERNLGPMLSGIVGPLGWGNLLGGLEKSQMAAEFGNRGLSNRADFTGGQIAGAANTGMNMAGGMQNPELMGRNDPSRGLDLSDAALDAAAAAGAAADPTMGGMAMGANGEAVDQQGFARGGVVRRKDMRGPNPAGPDEGYVGVHAGELILNRPQQAALARALMGCRGR